MQYVFPNHRAEEHVQLTYRVVHAAASDHYHRAETLAMRAYVLLMVAALPYGPPCVPSLSVLTTEIAGAASQHDVVVATPSH